MRISSGSPYEPKIGYCRAVVADGVVYVSGTTGADPKTGKMPKDVATQCRNALSVIGKALEDAGSNFDQVLQIRYILPDAKEFEACW
ncbi:MAG: RidA family protein, partial [Burkholderiales bacterium]|nr:RidA family protein [Burkholderiales bacterium]